MNLRLMEHKRNMVEQYDIIKKKIILCSSLTNLNDERYDKSLSVIKMKMQMQLLDLDLMNN